MSRLPCHKGVGARAGQPRSANQLMGIANHQRRTGNNDNASGRRVPGEIPYVTPDGGHTRYYADRCYLDAPSGLLEYKLEEGKRKGAPNNHVRREYCNHCGEIRDDSQQRRGTIDDPPPKERQLFDRAKFINSLDLSAAIIGTYTMGDFEWMSQEFPRLFPRHDGKGGEGRRHVPTLVLHGHKGFSIEKWTSATQQQESTETKVPSTTGNADAPMGIRGGGGQSSQDSASQAFTTQQFTPNEEGKAEENKTSPEGKKRPLLTYGSVTLKLPKTPKRLRKMKRPKASDSNDREDNQSNENAGDTEAAVAKGSSDADVIVIDSDSDEEQEPKEEKCNAANPPSTEKLPPKATISSRAPPTHALAQGKDSPSNIQHQQKRGPVADGPPRQLPPSTSPALPHCAPSSSATKPLPKAPIAPTSPLGPPQQSAASILSRVLGKPVRHKVMRPIFYNSGPDSSQDSSMSADLASDRLQKEDAKPKEKQPEKQPSNQPKVGWGGVKPARVFGGEVFFTQVRPRWCPPSPKGKERRSSDPFGKGNASDRSKASTEEQTEKKDEETKAVRGVHHPKFFLLFERSGSLVVIVSTSNLSPQTSLDGSWVQRFEPKESTPRPTYINRGGGVGNGNVDYGLPSDFGAVLTDFLKKQSEAAEVGMLPDVFLRRYVAGLSSGLGALVSQYRFEDAQVHLVSTVPGDHLGDLPKKGHRDATYRPRIAYGPQRVSFVLSRILNDGHIRSARTARAAATGRSRGGRMESDMPWLPPSLVTAMERLVVQPTSFGGNWTGDDLESIVQTYLQPHWDNMKNEDEHSPGQDRLLDLMDIVWPTMDFFDAMKRKRRAIWEKQPEEAAAITKRWPSTKPKSDKVEGHVFLSSVSFARLDRPCISRMALFTRAPDVMPYQSPSLHFKSICRLFQFGSNQPGAYSKDHLSWFMLTSACLSRGAQGQETPYRDPQTDSMSYSNFELGVLFCSRLVGDNLHDRLYVSDPSHIDGCQCGRGKRWYKPRHEDSTFLESVKKVHLPIPYQLRPKLYQDDPDSDFFSHTPYMNEILDGTGCVGNMKLTPLGQQIAQEMQR